MEHAQRAFGAHRARLEDAALANRNVDMSTHKIVNAYIASNTVARDAQALTPGDVNAAIYHVAQVCEVTPDFLRSLLLVHLPAFERYEARIAHCYAADMRYVNYNQNEPISPSNPYPPWGGLFSAEEWGKAIRGFDPIKPLAEGAQAVKEGAANIAEGVGSAVTVAKYGLYAVAALAIAAMLFLFYNVYKSGQAVSSVVLKSLTTDDGRLDASSIGKFAAMTTPAGRTGVIALSALENIKHDARCVCDACADASKTGFSRSAPGPVARDFYVTPSTRVSLKPLPAGEYGRTYLDTRPFVVEVASDVNPERQRLAMVHELLHVYDETHKLGISHEELHGLAYYILSEVIPGVTELDNIVG